GADRYHRIRSGRWAYGWRLSTAGVGGETSLEDAASTVSWGYRRGISPAMPRQAPALSASFTYFWPTKSGSSNTASASRDQQSVIAERDFPSCHPLCGCAVIGRREAVAYEASSLHPAVGGIDIDRGHLVTPTLDRVAQDGLRYNNFHTTALCPPTRG